MIITEFKPNDHETSFISDEDMKLNVLNVLETDKSLEKTDILKIYLIYTLSKGQEVTRVVKIHKTRVVNDLYETAEETLIEMR